MGSSWQDNSRIKSWEKIEILTFFHFSNQFKAVSNCFGASSDVWGFSSEIRKTPKHVEINFSTGLIDWKHLSVIRQHPETFDTSPEKLMARYLNCQIIWKSSIKNFGEILKFRVFWFFKSTWSIFQSFWSSWRIFFTSERRKTPKHVKINSCTELIDWNPFFSYSGVSW